MVSKKAIKRRVSAAVGAQSSLVKLIDRCDRMLDDMRRFGFEPGEILAFRDVVIDNLHGAEEELAAAEAAATEAGIKVRVWTRQPISFMRAMPCPD